MMQKPFSNSNHRLLRGLLVVLTLLSGAIAAQAAEPPPDGSGGLAPDARQEPPTTWAQVPPLELNAGLTAYWGVHDGTNGASDAQAYGRGFLPLTLINTYADYPNTQKESIYPFVAGRPNNPWAKPRFFERNIRRNIAISADTGIFIHDIEFAFEEDARKAWDVEAVRRASRAGTFEAFKTAYFKEWTTWYTEPLRWAKEQRPKSKVGVYGPQAFRRDYWGISGKSAQQIDGTHAIDQVLWQYIDPHVDFYVASIYVFYNIPASVLYMASNVEENYVRTRALGDRPVHAYVWLRTHNSNKLDGNREVDSYLAEAMAIVPYFSGAKATMLFGYDPSHTSVAEPPYKLLPLFARSLARVGALSKKIAAGRLVIDAPAHVLWNARHPLVRRIETVDNECIVMAVNPWQEEAAASTTDVTCNGRTFTVEMKGRHTTLARISGQDVVLY
ncbi:MAG: hypothetical protein AB7U75_10170 [Hyphomicrobiaceae bacterium]